MLKVPTFESKVSQNKKTKGKCIRKIFEEIIV